MEKAPPVGPEALPRCVIVYKIKYYTVLIDLPLIPDLFAIPFEYAGSGFEPLPKSGSTGAEALPRVSSEASMDSQVVP
eukprot:scaffold2448_cov155-Amphora_coffeaeformis.AAC.15